jgi:acyl-CoA hydrolase
VKFASLSEIDLRPWVRPGDVVVCSQGFGEPFGLTQRLVAQRHELGPVDVFLGPGYAPTPTFTPDVADRLRLRSWCATGTNAALAAAGALDMVPVHYSEMEPLFATGAMPCDVALLSASGPDAQGRLFLGLNVDYTLAAARRARVVILEVNEDWPCVPGAELPPDIRPDLIVRTRRSPLVLPEKAASDTDRAIARLAAGLIPDGATLSVGVGTLPDLVMSELRYHRDLGIHSPALVDSVVDLVEAGAVTNASKALDRGVTVGGLLMGSGRLLDFIRHGAALRLAPAAYTHSPSVLAAQPRFIALTGALEVDLTGQVNAETAQGRYVGAVGGQLDLIRGARASAGGVSITMLPATARQGRASRIVPRLSDALVTTPRSDVDRVVTEFGVAELRGKGIEARIQAMIDVAHPAFRESLAAEGERIARLAC